LGALARWWSSTADAAEGEFVPVRRNDDTGGRAEPVQQSEEANVAPAEAAEPSGRSNTNRRPDAAPPAPDAKERPCRSSSADAAERRPAAAAIVLAMVGLPKVRNMCSQLRRNSRRIRR